MSLKYALVASFMSFAFIGAVNADETRPAQPPLQLTDDQLDIVSAGNWYNSVVDTGTLYDFYTGDSSGDTSGGWTSTYVADSNSFCTNNNGWSC